LEAIIASLEELGREKNATEDYPLGAVSGPAGGCVRESECIALQLAALSGSARST